MLFPQQLVTQKFPKISDEMFFLVSSLIPIVYFCLFK